ncbi:MAG: carboxypeptidase-like regulatory domain-containing protein, partial [Treponema sp.]|nr:carboxypeptidase-like regulatory domain-containing protein [Treponema sp.]
GNKAEITFNFKTLQGKPVIDEALYRYYKEQGYDIAREKFAFFLDDYDKDIDSDIKEKPKYFFTASADRCKSEQGGTIEVVKKVRVTVLDAFGKPVKGLEIKVKESDGTEHRKTTGEDGLIELEDMIPQGNYGRFEIKENANAAE